MPFTDTDVRDWVGATDFSRATELAPRLLDLTVDEAAHAGDVLATARTGCARGYDVTLRVTRGKLSSLCTCPERRNCVHGAAVALAVRRRETQPTARVEDAVRDWQERLAAWSAAPPKAPTASTPGSRFAYALRWQPDATGEHELQLRIRMASNVLQGLAWHLYRPELTDADEDRLIESTLRRIRARQPQYRDGETASAASWLVVPAAFVSELLTRLAVHPNVEDGRRQRLAIHPARVCRVQLMPRQDGDVLMLVPTFSGGDGVLLGPPGGRWVAGAGELMRVSPEAERAWRDRAPIRIPAAERLAFERLHLPGLLEAGLVGATAEAEGEPRLQLVLVEADDALVVEERRWSSALQPALTVRRLERDAALDFLRDEVPRLIAEGWEVVGREDLRSYRLTTAMPTLRVAIVTGADWFDVHHQLVVGSAEVDWPALKEAVRGGSRYVRLGDGSWAPVPEAWFAGRQRLRERSRGKEQPDGALRMPCFEAPTLSELVDGGNDVQVDAGWEAFRARLESFGGVAPVAVPATFQGSLRPYQQEGLNYLAFLRDHGLHGILADDMGLGKTVQAAALLASNGAGPSLIVAPTSVVANWAVELRRFVPSLRVLVLHGPGRDVGAIAHHDVVITSYATARQDLTAHRAVLYDTVILDEAQAIKNARSQTARAMRQLAARHRLCLTGTPIENDTQDLWSLFAFLMPGLLGPVDAFRTTYATPIAMGERGPREALKRMIAPFILRRLKAQVAPDLPPRTDITLFCELAPDQRRVYDTLFADMRDQIQRKLQRDGLERTRLHVLDALLRLRQACCHPALLGTPETLHLESGKLEAALGLIQDLIAGGHRALVFSQFTQMLALLRRRLDKLHLPYAYLDGATRDRQALVDGFNAGQTPLFLISLKAGGSGLNLTGADYVIHYDPWWNPASEDQATDRAHRIGQARQVFNYKLVAKDTIEEKLLVLQSEKRGLVRDLLETDAGGKLLTAEAIAELFA